VHLGVTVGLGARVAKVFPEISEIITEAGEKYAGDLIVGADGLWSRCREALLGQKDSPLPTGDLAYRIVLTLDQITDPELREWISKPSVHFWIGPSAMQSATL
jgi:salicylate hydroxylase